MATRVLHRSWESRAYGNQREVCDCAVVECVSMYKCVVSHTFSALHWFTVEVDLYCAMVCTAALKCVTLVGIHALLV